MHQALLATRNFPNKEYVPQFLILYRKMNQIFYIAIAIIIQKRCDKFLIVLNEYRVILLYVCVNSPNSHQLRPFWRTLSNSSTNVRPNFHRSTPSLSTRSNTPPTATTVHKFHNRDNNSLDSRHVIPRLALRTRVTLYIGFERS